MPVEFDGSKRAGPGRFNMHALNAAQWVPGEALANSGDVLLAIDRHAPAARNQKQGELFRKTLEPAVRGRNAAGSEDQDMWLKLRHRTYRENKPPSQNATK